MLDEQILKQCREYFALMESDVYLRHHAADDQTGKDLLTFLNEVADTSDRIHLVKNERQKSGSFSVAKKDSEGRIVFRGIPTGHEFTSFVLAILQTSGRAVKESEDSIRRAQAVEGSLHFTTYVSLTCQICPTVVQAINALCVLNKHVSAEMVDGSAFVAEVEEKGIRNVPAVYLNGQPFHNGALSFDELLEKLTGEEASLTLSTDEIYDTIVIGAGPGGCTAAIYAARKGLKTVLIADRFGGQVNDTSAIENITSIPLIEGEAFAAALHRHVEAYPIHVLQRRVDRLEKDGKLCLCHIGNQTLKGRTVILATGAAWRNINVPGEAELKNKGVAYCPHCDGPLFAKKDVAVIGGGNSGVEAAIDLANTSSHVTLFEFLPELKADQILQAALRKLPNVTIHTNTAVSRIIGTDHVEGIEASDRDSKETFTVPVDGVFIQIGLAANTGFVDGFIDRNRQGEILVDENQMTNQAGIFACGDCASSPYKQVVIAMGSGASAALHAFDYMIRS
jgi:alkyl hydroperoxide reductase subunit F